MNTEDHHNQAPSPRFDLRLAHERLENFIGIRGVGACAAAVKAPVLVFDACHVGVVLRAVLFVEVVVAVGAMFGSSSPVEWVTRLSLFTGGALPSTLVWLIAACSLKRVLARVSTAVQYGVGVILGALSGLYGCGLLALVGLVGNAPWVASAFSGALLSAALVAALVLRARGTIPAATTARLSELQSRIRPHFLFNTLNSAIALVRAEPAKAETLLEDLSDLFRHALMEQSESVTLEDEIVLAQRYQPSSRCVLASGFRWNGHLITRQTKPGCLPCCCSLWWKMRSNTV
jgi:two-component system sensor histidine kinase AlgZ